MVRKRLEVQEDLQSRVHVFRALVIIALAVIIGRLWFLQIILGSDFNKMAQNNRIKERSFEAVRGNIYDRNKKLIVSSKPALSVSVTPYVFNKNKIVQRRLSKLLGMSLSEIKKKMQDKKTGPLQPKIIKRSVSQRIVYYIKERPSDFEGVKVEIRPERDYIHDTLAAHLLGYVGEVSKEELAKKHFKNVEMGDLVGKTGLENFYNSTLMGIKGKELLETNAAGRPVRLLKRKAAVAGSSIVTTIDLNIQKYAQESLEKAIRVAKGRQDKVTKKNYSATGGAIVVMDPRNGDVLALASYPTFSPKIFLGGIKQKDWQAITSAKNNFPINNRAVMSGYPPGSTFKPFVAIAGLQSGVITPSSSFQCTGSWRGSAKWPQVFRCWSKKGHGISNVYRGIVVSCDIFFYNVGYKIYQTRREYIQQWAKKFGFGAKTNISLPYEINGRVPTKRWKIWFNRGEGKEAYRVWYPGDTINLSIGQGDLIVTPLQMANAVSAIANGGTLYKPRLVKEILTADGDIKKRISTKKVLRRIDVNSTYLKIVREAMRNVTKGEGTAAAVFGDFKIDVAGKTGTSEIKGKQPTAWFVSFAPAHNPRYVAVAVIEQGGHGGSSAAPAIRSIYEGIYKNVASSKKNKKKGATKKEVQTD